jgi:hypothetical protein
MACFMDGRLVPLRIRKAHAESVDHHRVRISLAPKPRVEHIEARPRLRGSCPTAVYSVRIQRIGPRPFAIVDTRQTA